MNKTKMFKQGTYVTNGDVRGIVRGYSDNRCGVEFYIAHYRWYENGSFNKDSSYFNDGSFREMNETEINEFNQTLLKCGYIWDADSMKVTDLKALKETASTDNKPKYKTGDFLTSIDNMETFIFMRYEEDGWLLGWTLTADKEKCAFKCEVQRFNPAHPWHYSDEYDKELFLCKLKGTYYVWDKDENHFFSNPRMIKTNISDNVISVPNELQPINIPEGYRANIENGTIYFIKEFKDGDFIKTKNDSTIAIFKEISESGEIIVYVEYFRKSNDFLTAEDVTGHDINQWTHATDEDIKWFKEKLAENNYKWDEKRKELVNSFWVPENGETYFFISRHFNVIEAKVFDGEAHQKRLLLHNCFKTKEDATELAKEMKQMFINFNKQKYGILKQNN